ncbi:hypothetical protein Angca_006772, partial [Angiostrongylus cantonensis]
MDEILYRNDGAPMDENSLTTDHYALIQNVSKHLENGVKKACGKESSCDSNIQPAPINNDLNVAPWQKPDYANCKGFRQYPKTSLPVRFDMGCSFMSTLPSIDVVCLGRTMKKILMESCAARILGNGKTEKCQVLPKMCWRDDNPKLIFSLQLSFYENIIWNSGLTLGCLNDTPTSHDTPTSNGSETIPRGSGLKSYASDLEFPRIFSSYSFRITAEGHPELNNHIWEFHDCRMLTNADLPIFGGGQFPNLSIHMSEQAEPISILFGVDTFLDRVICNLSKSVVVYYENGPVEDYDVVFKEEIPHIVGSEFDSVNLKGIIKNTMTFLSKNLAHRGHTYWLFREEKTNHLRLYDFTNTCPNISSLSNWDPFLSPVVRILYKLSTDLIEKSTRNRPEKISDVIYGLLSAAAKIAENENYAETKICVHYSLAGVYLTFEFDEDHSKLDQYSYLIEGLDDVPSNSGYPRITSTIQVDCLTANSSSGDVQDDNQHFNASSLGSRWEPGEVRSECAIKALEHCLQSLTTMEGLDLYSKQRCCLRTDAGDNVDAAGNILHTDVEASFDHFRSSLLVRTASAYHHLVNETVNLNHFDEGYILSRCGITLCSIVLSTNPQSQHESVCYCLLTNFLSALIYSAGRQAQKNTDPLKVAPLSYRDRRILELAVKDVEIEGKFDCSTFWFDENDCEVKRVIWLRRIEAAIERFCSLLREHPFPHHSAFFPPTVALIPPAAITYRVAITAMGLAGILLLISREELENVNGSKDDDENPKRQIQRAIDLVDKARWLYKMSLDILDFNNDDEREYEVSIRISTVTALKFQYTINVKIHNIPATDRVNCELIDEVCELYTKIFSLLDQARVPLNDGSVYVNNLYDFGCALFIFSDHIKDESSPEWQDKCIHYLEAAIRAFQGVYKRKGHKFHRGNASKKLCEAYYVLIALKFRKIHTRPELSSLRAQKAAFKELAEVALTAQDHAIEMSDEDINPECKQVPLNLSEAAVLMVPVKLVNDTIRTRLCAQMLQWCLRLTWNVRGFECDARKVMEHYVKILERVQGLLRTMNLEWRNNPSMKRAYSQVLIVLPGDPEEAR